MASGNPGCPNAISGRGTGLTPGPGSMSPMGANHGCRLADVTRQTRHVRGRNRRAAGTAQTGWGCGCPAGDCYRGRQGVRWEQEVRCSGLQVTARAGSGLQGQRGRGVGAGSSSARGKV